VASAHHPGLPAAKRAAPGVTDTPSMTEQFGTAYFGVRDLDHARADLAEMRAQGFGWVLLPMTQDDAVWERRTFAALVTAAGSEGLVPVVSLWGGDEFGGEGIPGPVPVADWVSIARDTGAPILHVDEPKNRSLGVPAVLHLWGDDASAWLTVEPHRTASFDAETWRRPAVVGTDAYSGTVTDRVAATRGFAAATGRLDLAWVQAFRIASGEEAAVGEAVRAMAALAPRVGIWAWRGSTGRGELRSDRPLEVQRVVAAAMAEVMAGELPPGAEDR
jgi:hypothetical protein